MSLVNAQNWDEVLTKLYPEVQKNLENCPERIDVFLPSDAINESKEEGFKQKLGKDAKEIKKKLSSRGKLSIYAHSFKGNLNGFRSVAYTLCLGVCLTSTLLVNPLIGIAFAYIPCLEYAAYHDSKKQNYKAITNLGNIPKNVFAHYTKNI